MEQNELITLRVEFTPFKSGQKTSSQAPGKMLDVLCIYEDEKDESEISDRKQGAFMVEKRLKFLRFTLENQISEAQLKLRIRDCEGTSFDGKVSLNWANQALRCLENGMPCRIHTDDNLGKFKGLTDAYYPKVQTLPDIKTDFDPFPEIKADPMFNDVKYEVVDSLFSDWIEPQKN